MAQNLIFTKALDNMAAGNIAVGTNSFKVALLTAVPVAASQDTAAVWADVSSTEVASGNGYTTGGASIALSHAIYTSGGVHRSVVSGPANTQWPAATFSAAAAIVYRSDGSNNYVIAQIDFGGTKTSSGGTFQITWDSVNGIWYAGNTPV
jgi:hypothetical protein